MKTVRILAEVAMQTATTAALPLEMVAHRVNMNIAVVAPHQAIRNQNGQMVFLFLVTGFSPDFENYVEVLNRYLTSLFYDYLTSQCIN